MEGLEARREGRRSVQAGTLGRLLRGDHVLSRGPIVIHLPGTLKAPIPTGSPRSHGGTWPALTLHTILSLPPSFTLLFYFQSPGILPQACDIYSLK